jgi:hypothetical protein
MALDDTSWRDAVDVSLARGVRLARFDAGRSRVIGLLDPVELMLALKLRARRAPRTRLT